MQTTVAKKARAEGEFSETPFFGEIPRGHDGNPRDALSQKKTQNTGIIVENNKQLLYNLEPPSSTTQLTIVSNWNC
jgi:hypothetical protein